MQTQDDIFLAKIYGKLGRHLKIADFVFKIVSWIILAAAVEYAGRRYHIAMAIWISRFLFLTIGLPLGHLSTILAVSACKHISDFRIRMTLVLSLMILVIAPEWFLLYTTYDFARDFAQASRDGNTNASCGLAKKLVPSGRQ